MIVFPADRKYWTPQARRIRAVRPASDGQYRVQNLPAGDYCIGVMTDVEQYQWFDPALLAQLKPQDVSVTLAEGDKKTQDLRLGIR